MMRRPLLIVSTAMLVAIIFLMIRGLAWIDCIEFGTGHSYTFACSDAGCFIIGRADGPWYAERGFGARSIHRDRPHAHQPWRFDHPAEVARQINTDTGHGAPSIHTAHGGWLAAACSLPIVIAWIRGRQQGWSGGCAACGYDLTGNTRGVCPECGTPIATRPAKEVAMTLVESYPGETDADLRAEADRILQSLNPAMPNWWHPYEIRGTYQRGDKWFREFHCRAGSVELWLYKLARRCSPRSVLLLDTDGREI